MRRFFNLALKYMARRKLRTTFTVLAILFGVMVMFGTWTAMPALRDAKLLSAAQTTYSADNTSSDNSLDLAVALMNSFGMISLFVGGFLIFNTYRAVLAERQHDLALLRMIGAARHHIAQLILTEALLQGVVGTCLGLISGWIFAGWLMRFIYDTGIFPNIDLPAMSVPRLDALLPATALGIGTVLVSAYFPARRATTVSPLTALRPTSPQVDRRSARVGLVAGIVCVILGGLALVFGSLMVPLAGLFVLTGAVLMMPSAIALVLPRLLPRMRHLFPRTADIAYGNIMRQRGRAAVTANSLMVGFAVFIASVTMVDAMYAYMIRLFTFHMVADYLIIDRDNMLTMITSNMDGQKVLNRQMVAKIRALTEVKSMMGVRVGATTYQGKSLMLVGIDPTRSAVLRPNDFAAQSVSTERVLQILQEQRAVFVTLQVAKDFGLKLNDTLLLTTITGSTQFYTVVGIVADITVGTGKLGLILSHEHLREDFGIRDDLFLYLNLQSGSNLDSLQQLLRGNAMLVDVKSFRQMGISGVTDFTKSVYILAAIVIIPALLGLINTLTISVFERTREIGIMRAIGSGQGYVQRIVLVETLFLSVLGAVVGIAVGLVCGASLVAMFAPATLTPMTGIMQFQFPGSGILIALIVGPTIALLTSLIPARRAAHLNIVESLRFE
ncbi:MAG: FtsX-like permease family protein [Anaerolineae bacterium]|nr:FtsX-like permease family protein [Anaerolineae bacterium]